MKLPKLHLHKKSVPSKPSPDPKFSSVDNESEIEEYLDIRDQRRWIFPRAALAGVGAGILALLFRAALAGGDALRNGLIAWARNYSSWGWIFPVVFSAACAALSLLLTRRYAPEAAGSGIPHLEAVLHRFRKLNWRRVLPVKFIGGLLSIGGGFALGREGPTVQMGGTAGSAVSDFLKVSPRERLTLISAGAGAGLAAIFNAPLSGLMFVMEELRGDFQPIVFGAVLLAAMIANIISRAAGDQLPYFSVPNYPMPPLTSLPFFAILGIAAGLLGVLFNKTLLLATNLYSHIPQRYSLVVIGLTGALVGLAGWFSPTLIGSGGTLADLVLNGRMALLIIPVFFFLRFILTTFNYGSGVPGGIFAPLLVLGALLGLGIGLVSHSIAPSIIPIPAVFAVVGMAAYFTAIVRAPLTGITLIIEMTGNYSQMLPLLVACFCAYAIAELLKNLPVYESLLERDLKRAGIQSFFEKPIVMDFTVKPGAPFAGRTIRSLNLPQGCILVRCSDGKHEFVPTAATTLEPHMRITAMISPEAAQSLEVLRHGCGADHR
jgi:CIC family chloride channel protein